MTTKTFASDNYAGVLPEVMEALAKANQHHAASYGADEITERVIKKFRSLFGEETEIFFVYNGTGANVLGLQAMTQSFNSIICSDLAHINVDESTAPEKFLGCKLLTIPTMDGKIYPEQIEARLIRFDDQHHPQPKVISISQTTEYGTVYTVEEIKAISKTAQKHGLLFHMDGSRITNAAVSLREDFATFTKNAGVDVLSFGGTKNGLMFGEAILIFNSAIVRNFKYIRKQGMQLHSKMRFISAQFDALLHNDLWRNSASHSNNMATYLADQLSGVKEIRITQKVQANSIFAVIPENVIAELQRHTYFYVWNEKTSEVRLMCAFDTTKKEVDEFVLQLKRLMN
jgi:threonine aldolase